MGKEADETFPQRHIPMAYKHTQRCSTSLIIREMQLKTTVRHHLVPIRTGTRKTTDVTSDEKLEKPEPSVGLYNGTPAVGDTTVVPQK